MKVVLLVNIKGIGQMGDIKNVSDGYGRNFLLPRRMAKLATSSSLIEAESLKLRLASLLEVEMKDAEAVASKLSDFNIEISRRASKTGTLYDGIEKSDIVEAIKTSSNIELTENMVLLGEHIKKVGEYAIDIQLHPEVKTQVKLNIAAL